MRRESMFGPPGIPDTLDRATALTDLDAVAFDADLVDDALEVSLEHQDDIARTSDAAIEADRRRGEGRGGPVVTAPAADLLPAAPGLVPGRTCGTCTMCCKTFAIPEVDKVSGQWCRHLVQRRGCGIHATRPDTCRLFFCHWMRNGRLGPEWRPDVAKFLMYTEMEGRRLVVAPDAGAPTAWRRPPYGAQIKRWAALGAPSNHQVLVFVGRRAIAVLPDRDHDLGIVEIGDKVIYRMGQGRIEVDHLRRG